jgi:hypothetical protein
MNEILKDAIMILSGVIGGTIFILIKNKFFTKAKIAIVKIIPDEDKAKVKELYEKGLVPEKLYKEVCSVLEPTEQFDTKKAVTGLTNLKNPVLWMKDIASIFNLRKLIIIGIIISVIAGYSYYKGRINKPVQLIISEEVEFTIPVPNSDLALYHPKHSTELQWINTVTGKVVGKVKVKDIPELKKLLKPYGFHLKPFVTVGGSLGEKKTGFEAGAGIDFFKYFRWNANAFITNLGAYLGAGYQITDNFDIMLGAGKGWKGDNRVGIFGKFKF